ARTKLEQGTPSIRAASTEVIPVARQLPNGAIVSDSGSWYWTGGGWEALLPNPPDKAPGGMLGKERKEVAHLLRGSGFGGLQDVTRYKEVAAELAAQVREVGSLAGVE